ncbi:hypothetical protein [Neobacillus niacini]|uniref:hypothetical protein n=1 Tax=Neobacillus niacini TaxID=86668 RepID=UPI002FFE0ED4
MIEGKGLGGKRIARKGASFTNKEEGHINKLATACDMTPAELIWRMCRKCLYDPMILNEFQKEYCKEKAYRIILINGEYVLSGREDL